MPKKQRIKYTNKRLKRKNCKKSKKRRILYRHNCKKTRKKLIVQNGGFTNPFGGMTTVITDFPQSIRNTYNMLNPPPPPAASNPSTYFETSNPTKGHFNRIPETSNMNNISNFGKIYKDNM